MGNGNYKYYSADQSKTIIGENWTKLEKQLERRGKYVDFETFEKIIRCRFERMVRMWTGLSKTSTHHFMLSQPKILCECLFQAFVSDLFHKIDVLDFLSSLAVIKGRDRPALLKFLFRVYDVRIAGHLERSKVEQLLHMAYGERIKRSTEVVKKQLDAVFRLGYDRDRVTMREFEGYGGALDVLGGWVEAVLNALLEVTMPRLRALDRYPQPTAHSPRFIVHSLLVHSPQSTAHSHSP